MDGHVLIVEDERRLRDIVRDYFAAHGLTCDLARDGEAAMDLFAMTPYYWKTGVEGVKRLQEAGAFQTEIAFDFLVYERL